MSFSSEEEKKERSDPQSENFVLHPPLGTEHNIQNIIIYSSSNYTVRKTVVDPDNIPSCYFLTLTRKQPFENCSKCGRGHSPSLPYCPVLPCKTCFDPDHPSAHCPFFHLIPTKGAAFDRVNYVIICGCGNAFNEDKWACALCGGRPKLQSKYCHICNSEYVHHSSHECPKDKALAAQFKAIRDQDLARTYLPYV